MDTCCELYDAELQTTAYNWMVNAEACTGTAGKPVDAGRCAAPGGAVETHPAVCCDLGSGMHLWTNGLRECTSQGGARAKDPSRCGE